MIPVCLIFFYTKKTKNCFLISFIRFDLRILSLVQLIDVTVDFVLRDLGDKKKEVSEN